MTSDDAHGPEDDGSLARRIAAGPAPDAERELAVRFGGRIRVYGIRHLRSEERARELVQEVLAIVLDALRRRRVEELAHIDRFILGTCRNVVSGWRRGERRRADLADTLATTEPVTAPPTPSSRRLTECMMRLPARERSVLVLSYCEERDADDVANVLGLSAGNVRVIRHRALRAIRTCLGVGVEA